MIGWQLYVDEEFRENLLKHVDKCEVWDLWLDAGWQPTDLKNSEVDFIVQEPSAQDIIDAVEDEEVDPYHHYDVMGYFPEDEIDEDGFEVRV